MFLFAFLPADLNIDLKEFVYPHIHSALGLVRPHAHREAESR